MEYQRIYDYYKPQTEEDAGSVKRHLPAHLMIFIALVALFAFGPGLNGVPFLFLPALTILVLFTRSAPSLWWSVWLCAVPALAIGKWFAFAGSFITSDEVDSPWSAPSASVWAAVWFALVQSIAIGLALTIDRLIARQLRAFRPWVEEFLVLPVVWCALWTVMAALGPTGDFANYGYALSMLDIEPLTVGVSWWLGRYVGGAFIIGLAAGCLAYLVRTGVYRELSGSHYYGALPTTTTTATPNATAAPAVSAGIEGGGSLAAPRAINKWHPVWWSIYLFSALYLFGSLYRQYSPYQSFYQRPVVRYAPPTTQVSCMTGGTIPSTRRHLRHSGFNSRLVVWSERSTQTANAAELIRQALNVSQWNHVYLALAFEEFTDDSDGHDDKKNKNNVTRNRLVMIQPPNELVPHSSVAFETERIYAVPAFEGSMATGSGSAVPDYLPTVDTPYGRIGVLLGFDLNFNNLVQKAVKQQVDILIQPIQTHGPSGLQHARWNRLTAIDGGFTLIRCAAGGLSGVFDQFLRSHSQKLTLPHNDSLVMSVPLFGHSRTAYSWWGNLLGWICVVLTAGWIVLLILLRLKSWHRFSYQFRSFLEALDAHFGNRPSVVGGSE